MNEQNYNMPSIINTLTEWMKEAKCYNKNVRKPITFSILNNNNIEIITGDAGKMIGKQGSLVRKYTAIFAEIIGKENLEIQLVCPNIMIAVGSTGEDIIIYNKPNT